MALITRVSRLLRADLHAVIDRIEEPDVLLRQAVRDMEEALAEQGRAAKRLACELERLAAREAELERALGEIDGELDVCFEAGKDDLARALVRRKLETRGAARAVTEQRERLAAEQAAVERRLAENRSRLEAMRQKAEILAAAAHEAGADPTEARLGCVGDDEVEVAFLREQRARATS